MTMIMMLTMRIAIIYENIDGENVDDDNDDDYTALLMMMIIVMSGLERPAQTRS